MHSAELARLAGVTVRTLRHYHQVGVLPEPARGSNGYRRYDVHDLIRVLRIRRLVSLGVPLGRIAGIVDGVGGDARGVLAELDAELAAQIDHLTRQRELIAQLGDAQAPPDVPPELAPFLAAAADREQSVLLAHLAGEQGLPELTRLYERLAAPELSPAAAALTDRITRLGPDSTEQEVTELVEDFASALAGVIEEFGTSERLAEISRPGGLAAQYMTEVLSEHQQAFLARLQERLDRDGTAS